MLYVLFTFIIFASTVFFNSSRVSSYIFVFVFTSTSTSAFTSMPLHFSLFILYLIFYFPKLYIDNYI